MKALCPRGNVIFLHLPFFFSFISLCRSFIFGRWLLFMRSREFRNGRLKIKIFSSVDISVKIENSKFKRFYDGMHELKTGCRKTRNCSEIVAGILDFCLADSRSLSAEYYILFSASIACATAEHLHRIGRRYRVWSVARYHSFGIYGFAQFCCAFIFEKHKRKMVNKKWAK